MRIVLLNQYYAPDTSATAQVLSDLGEGLARRGNEVVALCCNRSYSDPDRRYPARETIGGVEVRRSRTTGFGRASSLGRVLDYLTYLIGVAWMLLFQKRPDVVVSLTTPPMIAALGLVLARLRGARSIFWVMDVYPDLAFELGVIRPGSIAGRLFGALSGFTLRRSRVVLGLGSTMARHLERASGREVGTVHTWADGDVIVPRPVADHPLREEWGWNERFVVLYSGNMGMAHEFDTLLDAAERLRERREVLFAFVGGGPRREEVHDEVRRRGLPNIEFRPYVAREQLGQSLTAGDLHLVTLRERMPGLLVPSKIYGILAAGRPTIYVGPEDCEIADIIREGSCGAGLPIGGGEELAAAILRYADDPGLREEQGQAARQLFDRKYTREHGLADFEKWLSE